MGNLLLMNFLIFFRALFAFFRAFFYFFLEYLNISVEDVISACVVSVLKVRNVANSTLSGTRSAPFIYKLECFDDF